jgi:anthranilate synthase component 1
VSRGEYNFGPGDLARLARPGHAVPLCREIGADLLTPVAAALRLRRGARAPFLLESIEGGETVARYSFLGRDPVGWLRLGDEATDVPAGAPGPGPASSRRRDSGGRPPGPLEALRKALRPFRPVRLPDLPRFVGGAVGFASYDLVRRFERLPRGAHDDLEIPALACGLYDTVVAFDHLRQRLQIVTLVVTERDGRMLRGAARRRMWEAGRRRIEAIAASLARPARPDRRPRPRPGRWRASTSRAAYLSSVRRARAAIAAGEIFQVVLSQRFDRRAATPPLGVYRALRRINPSPYMFHLDHDGAALSGASPEMLVRVEGDRVRTRPIAGTRPRGRNEEEDRRLERALRADAKERAEHVMLVDLARNDLGRVCRPGSVVVSRFLQVERFSHVMHLVSEVEGRLRPGCDALDAFASAFPAGTVSGAPKVRAMEIIDELEPLRRGPYAGAVFWADGAGSLDSCLTIRTVLERQGTVHVQAGAGIVADSVPVREHRECLAKAQALIAAVERAEAAAP